MRINEIDQQAADWVARTSGSVPTAELQRALDAWLAADPRHLGAYLKCCAAMERLDRHAALLRGDPISRLRSGWDSRRNVVVAGGIAAWAAAMAIAFRKRRHRA